MKTQSIVKKIYFFIVAFNLLLFVLALLGKDYRIYIPYEFVLVRVYGTSVLLADDNSGSVLVSPDINGYAVLDEYIVGFVTKNQYEEPDSDPGYFIVNAKTRDAITGLSQKEYITNLKKIGIDKKPKLNKPARWRYLIQSWYYVLFPVPIIILSKLILWKYLDKLQKKSKI